MSELIKKAFVLFMFAVIICAVFCMTNTRNNLLHPAGFPQYVQNIGAMSFISSLQDSGKDVLNLDLAMCYIQEKIPKLQKYGFNLLEYLGIHEDTFADLFAQVPLERKLREFDGLFLDGGMIDRLCARLLELLRLV